MQFGPTLALYVLIIPCQRLLGVCLIGTSKISRSCLPIKNFVLAIGRENCLLKNSYTKLFHILMYKLVMAPIALVYDTGWNRLHLR